MANKRVLLDKRDIERAIRNTVSNSQAARYLGVSMQMYKREASQYTDENGLNLYEKHLNPSGKGTHKMALRYENGPGLMDILEGRVNPIFFDVKMMKARIVQEGYLGEGCGRCGFHERRVLDYKIPVILHFKDNNKRNWKLDNLEFLCYNCYFLMVGEVFEKKQVAAMEDYTVLRAKAVDFELPVQHEEAAQRILNLNNYHINMEDDRQGRDHEFGDDLISTRKVKAKK